MLFAHQVIDPVAVYDEPYLMNRYGKIHGYGSLIYGKNGSVYKVNWVDGHAQGQGKMTFANGDVYEGNWHNGEISGYGEYTFAIDDSSLKDEWVDGTMVNGYPISYSTFAHD